MDRLFELGAMDIRIFRDGHRWWRVLAFGGWPVTAWHAYGEGLTLDDAIGDVIAQIDLDRTPRRAKDTPKKTTSASRPPGKHRNKATK